MSAARRGSAADALARMQRAAAAPSPATRTPEAGQAVTDVTPAAGQPQASSEAAAVPPAAAPAAPRPMTRTTLDLDRERYVTLRSYAARHAAKGAEVLRALIDQLDSDPSLAQVIAHRLATDRDSLR